MSRLARPPKGTHWQYDPDHRFDGQFPKMQLIDTQTGANLGSFYTDVFSGRISMWLESRSVIKKARTASELRYPILGEWEVKNE